jgi:uncharacterized membrane protein YhaH (DUF805 family)
MEWYLAALRKFADFTGRARRKEYWFFVLFNVLVAMGISFVEALLGLGGFLSMIYSLAMLIPGLAVGARRLHDIGRSGWWLLIGLVPLVGWIVLIVFALQDSEPHDNQYGPPPKLPAYG